MYDEDRKALHKWFKEHKSYGTYHNYSPNKKYDEYVIEQSDVEAMLEMIRR